MSRSSTIANQLKNINFTFDSANEFHLLDDTIHQHTNELTDTATQFNTQIKQFNIYTQQLYDTLQSTNTLIDTNKQHIIGIQCAIDNELHYRQSRSDQLQNQIKQCNSHLLQLNDEYQQLIKIQQEQKLTYDKWLKL